MYIEYGLKEIEHLKKRDKKLGAAIDQIGRIEREMESDLFSSVVSSIVGQQISMAAARSIKSRMLEKFGEITVDTICASGRDELQSCGTTFRKADYIKDCAEKVRDKQFDIEALYGLPDDEVVKSLTALKGIGVWTAEMIMLFCMGRPNILSFGDLAIQRGMRMLYHHKKIDRALFERYARRYTPYGTVASLYLWRIAAGAIPGMQDYKEDA